jgi:hypothetical protein
MRIPMWLTIVAAIFVTGFGVFRIYIATRKPDPNEPPPRSGFHRMAKRTHGLLGVVYVLLGAGLFAVSLGWNPRTKRRRTRGYRPNNFRLRSSER